MMQTAIMWRCKACLTDNEPHRFLTVDGTTGLLCPVCYKRYTLTPGLVGQARCPLCQSWSPRADYVWEPSSRRGDGVYHCPKCRGQTELIEEF